ncbi:MAG: serine protease [Polyangiales bacterium]
MSASPSWAQDIDDASAERAIRASVKVVMLTPGGGGSTGSGSMIDPRGYVLTNFHVVGHMRPETGTPGTLLSPDNRVHLATVDDARRRPVRVGVESSCAATYVRPRVDRIIGDANGNPVGNVRFPTIPMAGTRALRPGSRVWAFGFPLGVRTINVTQGSIAGFQMNAREEVAWLRSDAEFNPGNSGGMLVDARGQLVAVPTQVYHGRGRALEPVELARPVERIPAEWLEAMRRGAIEDVRITGVGAVGVGRPIRDRGLRRRRDARRARSTLLHAGRRSRAARIRTEPPPPWHQAAADGCCARGVRCRRARRGGSTRHTP